MAFKPTPQVVTCKSATGQRNMPLLAMCLCHLMRSFLNTNNAARKSESGKY